MKILEKMGFVIVRVNGSHFRMKNGEGRITTAPVYNNKDLPKGLLQKIVRGDLDMTLELFERFVNQ